MGGRGWLSKGKHLFNITSLQLYSCFYSFLYEWRQSKKKKREKSNMPSRVTENSKSSSWINWLFEETSRFNRLCQLKNISEWKRPLWTITFQGNRKMSGKKFVTEKWPSGTRLFCTQDVILCNSGRFLFLVNLNKKWRLVVVP